jgi:hypothetical protein
MGRSGVGRKRGVVTMPVLARSEGVTGPHAYSDSLFFRSNEGPTAAIADSGQQLATIHNQRLIFSTFNPFLVGQNVSDALR